MSAPTPPGWYPDPTSQGQRYFDGRQWTQHRITPPPQHKGTGKTVLWVVVGVIVLFFGGCATLIAFSMNAADEPGHVTGAEVGLNQRVSDGKFSFIVTDVSTPANWVGDPRPRGKWVIATMTVTNTGDQPQSFFVQNQKLIDTAGREYAADTMASYAMNPSDSTMVIDMNPGFSLTVKVPFDVPPGAQPAAVVVHDSAFSGGAKVNLT
jgi:hypothetical protein